MSDKLYIQTYTNRIGNIFTVPLESLVTLFICKCVEKVNFQILLIEDVDSSKGFEVDLSEFSYQKDNSHRPPCKMPCMTADKNIVISGLCAVNRQIVKLSNQDSHLLGFKNACLKAPNEISIWTKFCEIDMITTIYAIFSKTHELTTLPIDIVRFENHMSQPVRIHNIYKIAQKNSIKSKFEAISVTPKEDLDVPHLYVEGPFMTIADIILFPQIFLFFKMFGIDNLSNIIPLVIKWYKHMLTTYKNTLNFVKVQSNSLNTSYLVPDVKSESLYKADPKRYKPQNRIYTRQIDIDNALEKIEKLDLDITTPGRPFGVDLDIKWELIPIEEIISSKALPLSRVERKYEQLKNLAKAVVKLARSNDIIVDFCSGSGHLGIILAQLLPKCSIILLENKEESLNRAKQRIETLNLTNVQLLQCNLDYFNTTFNIGVSLHACGVATDLVVEQCMRQKASFICCPCCYGGLHNCHHLIYPRSKVFQNVLTLKDYLVLGHSADQTHDEGNAKTKQGSNCMNIIDNDRILYAQENGYNVHLGKLEPASCTPKNNLLVGWFNS